MEYFVTYTRDGDTIYCSYQGQDQDTIISLLTELGTTDINFITQEEYNNYVQSHQK